MWTANLRSMVSRVLGVGQPAAAGETSGGGAPKSTPRLVIRDGVVRPWTDTSGLTPRNLFTEGMKREYFRLLDDWVFENPGTRVEAVARVIDWVKRCDLGLSVRPLNLRGLGLTALPPLPYGVKHLDIGGNPLQRLRSLPPSLRVRYADGTTLRSIDTMLPSSLRRLDIHDNAHLERLPHLETLGPRCVVHLDAHWEPEWNRIVSALETPMRPHGRRSAADPDPATLPDYESALTLPRWEAGPLPPSYAESVRQAWPRCLTPAYAPPGAQPEEDPR